MEKQLTILEAYSAVIKFLEIYYENTSYSKEVGSLLNDMKLCPEGGSSNPRTWDNWLKCVHKIIEERPKSQA